MKKVLLVFQIILIITICSCENEEYEMCIELSPDNSNVLELTDVINSDEELKKMSEYGGNIKEFICKYNAKCVRKTEYGYRMVWVGSAKVLIVRFNLEGKKINSNIYKTIWLKDDYCLNLDVGKSVLSEVRNFDPVGQYYFLYTGRNDTPRISYHYTADGYWLKIHYNDFNTITKMEVELI